MTSTNMLTIPMDIKRLVEVISSAGGSCLLIGGGVIDSICKREVKDWDIEVYNLSLSEIEMILEANSYQADLVGKAFGIIKTKAGELDVDLSVPRRENKSGTGHKGFDVEFDPTMTPKEAGRRRDLTINSMYLNMETGEIVDPFNGLNDLQQGIIRATDPQTFAEDPLRVLRVMQLLPRKGKVVDPATIDLCKSLKDQFSTLPKERIFEEFSKLLLKAERPSEGLNFLLACEWLDHFPALRELVGCPQNPVHHPEGDVWAHTLLVVDAAAQFKGAIPKDWQLAYMLGALLHDVGKPSVTAEDMTAYGHDMAGVPVTRGFMAQLTNDKELTERVVKVVQYHMAPGALHRGQSKVSAWKRLHNNIRLDVIGLISKADSLSRYGDLNQVHLPSELALGYFSQFGENNIPPVLLGRHLISAGMKPGKEFGVLLRKAYEIQIEEGIEDVDLLLGRVICR